MAAILGDDGGGGAVWDSVMEITKMAQERGSDPLLWAVQLSSCLNSAGVALPSVELSHMLVSYICWDNNVPILWKFLEKALALKIVPPLFLLALLSSRFLVFDSLVFFFSCIKIWEKEQIMKLLFS